MQSKIESGSDVVDFILSQHQQVKRMFDEVLKKSGRERERAFVDLRRMLAVHETAEEEIIHPVARRALAGGEAIVRARLREERMAKDLLTNIEKLDVDSREFEDIFRELRDDVVAHADAEQNEELSRLRDELDEEDLRRMRRAAELAEALAPTRPHAGVESLGANLLVGPFAAMIDRARDALAEAADEEEREVGIVPNLLGWFSIGLGLFEVVGAQTICRALGIRSRTLVRVFGMREIAAGVGLLTQRKKGPWLWARVAGDALDAAVLGAALLRRNRKRGNVALAVAAVSPVIVADLVYGKRLGVSA